MNLGFFDGHAELRDHWETRPVELYFPSGSIVRNRSGLGDRTVRVGDVVR